jgi:hypothetical protein
MREINEAIPFHQSMEKTDASKLDDFITCHRLYFYLHVLGWKPMTPNNHLVFGTAVHLALEHLLLNGYGNSSVMVAYDLFLKEYRKSFDPDTDEMYWPKTPDNFFIVLAMYAEKYKRDLDQFKVLYTEISGSIAITDQDSLFFRMDSILENKETGKKQSLEHKTGSYTYLWQDQWPISFQVGTYTHVLYCLYGPEDISGIEMNAMFFFKGKKAWQQMNAGTKLTVKEPYDFMRFLIHKGPSQMQMWLWNITYWYDQIQWHYDLLKEAKVGDDILMAFPMIPKGCIRYGRVCEFYDYCLAWKNPLQRCNEAPLGFRIEYWDPTEKDSKHKFEFGKGGELSD